MTRTALVAGPTGLVGQHLLQRLLLDPAYTAVRALSRRPLDLRHERLQVVQTDFYHLPSLGAALQVDDVFCCLGTTLNKAGSRAAFEDVDYRMVIELANATQAAGAHQFIAVSAVGASTRSPAFYNRVKGRMEAAVSALNFAAVHIVRPSLLLGSRGEKRPSEEFAQKVSPLLSPLFVGPLLRYRPVAAEDVAEAMLRLALRGEHGVHAHHLPLAD